MCPYVFDLNCVFACLLSEISENCCLHCLYDIGFSSSVVKCDFSGHRAPSHIYSACLCALCAPMRVCLGWAKSNFLSIHIYWKILGPIKRIEINLRIFHVRMSLNFAISSFRQCDVEKRYCKSMQNAWQSYFGHIRIFLIHTKQPESDCRQIKFDLRFSATNIYQWNSTLSCPVHIMQFQIDFHRFSALLMTLWCSLLVINHHRIT